MQYSTLGVLVTVLHHQKNQNRLFGMAAMHAGFTQLQ